MKQVLALFLCLCLMLAGCSSPKADSGVAFYYPRKQYLYHDVENVIVPEKREISGHSGDLQYLITLYLMGPKDESLSSPFPPDTRLEDVNTSDQRVQLILSSPDNNLSDSLFSLACACIAQTCFPLIPSAEEVSVTLAERTVVITRDNLFLTDTLTGSPQSESSP